MTDDDMIRLVVDDDPPVQPAPSAAVPEPVPEPALAELPEDASTVQRVEHLLLKTMAVLEQGTRWKDGRLALAAVREARACLELTAKLQGELAQAAQLAVGVQVVGPVEDFDAAVSELLLQITQRASPACARCGSSCSECASEALPMGSVEDLYRAKASLARDRGPGGSETPVVDADVVEDVRQVAAPETATRRALPAPCADDCACFKHKDRPGRSGGPVSIVRGDERR